ncbi:MAG TPA: hypothetical protein VGU20_02860 [Stellaceae bacterium]|nr:hypothetical protein [Stellaceae bacterium]
MSARKPQPPSEGLLDRLDWSVEKQRARKLSAAERDALARDIEMAVMEYDGIRQREDETRRMGAECSHELAPLLRDVLDLLQHEPNWPTTIGALRVEPTAEGEERAVKWHDAIVRGLARIADALPTPPTPKEGAPSGTSALRALCARLIAAWEKLTRDKFIPYWDKEDRHLPKNPATAFVYEVVKLYCPEREMISVRKVLVRIRDERAAKSP